MNSLDDYKTVLIIGNGFDLNLNYPTSYSDFMESSNFKSLISESNNILAKYLEFRMKDNGDNWIDIENELGKYAYILRTSASIAFEMPQVIMRDNHASHIQNSFRSEYTQLCAALKDYLRKYDELEKHDESIYKSNSFAFIKKILYEQSSCYVVNFNYTSFVEKVINEVNVNYTDFCIRQIHGSLKDDIVFGVQDNMELQREHVFLYKSYNKCQDVRELPQILDNADKIIFFGYSLGETDHSYFDDFFNSQTIKSCQKKKFVFYHYGQTAYDDIIWQLRTLTKNRTSYLNQYNDIEFVDNSKALE